MKIRTRDTERVKHWNGNMAGRALSLAAVFSVAVIGMTGCRSDMAAVQQAPIVDGNAANDPANVNMAAPVSDAAAQPVYQAQRPAFDAARAARNGYAPRTVVAGQSYSASPQAYGQDYPVQNYPVQDGRQTRSEAYNYNTQPPQGSDAYAAGQYGADDDQLYSELLDTSVPMVQQPPPPLPAYEQPVAPGPDYLWTPGYWNYANAGYYYVPGNWVAAPFVGALWTPGWWGHTGRGYGWHRGYWGRHVGYYGGVNYGFGFIGLGYQGGYWNNDHFQYNRDCNHVDPRVVNNYVYQRNVTVINNSYVNDTRVSYNGGPGGLQRRPLPAEFAAQREVHISPLPAQIAERQAASQNRQQFFAANQGRPQQLFAAHPVIERNVQLPQQLAQPQQFNRGTANMQAHGFNPGQGLGPASGSNNGLRGSFNQPGRPQQAAVPQQKAVPQQQIASQQRQQAVQQLAVSQQRVQAEGMRQQQEREMQQQRVQDGTQRLQQQTQARQQQEQQRQQQNQVRQQQEQLRQQQNVRQQQVEQGRQQQVQRQQQDQQRQFQQARAQQDQQRVQQQLRSQQDQQQRAVQQQSRQQEIQRTQQPTTQRMAQEGARQQPQQPHAAQPQPGASPSHGGDGHEHGR